MKTIAIWSGVAVLGFVVMAMQMGMAQKLTKTDDAPTAVEPPPPPKVIPRFPEDLAAAAKAQSVPAAAEFKVGPDPHPLVFLRVNGVVHPWQDQVREDWQADSIGTTQLVVVLGVPTKSKVSYHDKWDNPKAPPITRWRFEQEVSVIEAKTGRILANRLFRNEPRPIMQREAWETTAIGRVVSAQQVFGWVSRMSRSGFPEAHDPTPITLQVD